jgi:hypothetical protein
MPRLVKRIASAITAKSSAFSIFDENWLNHGQVVHEQSDHGKVVIFIFGNSISFSYPTLSSRCEF